MTALSPAVATASQMLGWTLIHSIWQGMMLAVLLGLVLLMLPRRMARARYAAGCVTLLTMLAAPMWTYWQLAIWGTPAMVLGTPWPVDFNATWTSTAAGPAPVAAHHLMPWLAAIWSLGVSLCLLRHAGGLWQARRMVRIGTRPASASLEVMKNRLAAALRLRSTVTMLESARVQVPVVIGFLKPVVLIPTSALTGLTPKQIEAVLAHELAHVRRHDYLVNLLQTSVETLLFYHPAVWWVSHTVRAEREHCCDDLAVAVCGDRVLYARALTAIETVRHEAMTGALAVTGSSLSARVRRLLGTPQPARLSSSGYVVAAVTAVMVSGAGTFSWIDTVPELGRADSPKAYRGLLSGSVAEAAVIAVESDEVSLASLPRQTDAQPAPRDQESPAAPREQALEEEKRTEAAESNARLDEARQALREAQASVRAAASRQREAAAAVRRAAREARQSGLASEARELQLEARALAREATRHAREVLQTAQAAMREAARFARESQRLQRNLQRELRLGARPSTPARRATPAVPAPPAPPAAAVTPDGPPPPPPPTEAPTAPEADLPDPPTPASPPEPPLPPQESRGPRLPSREEPVVAPPAVPVPPTVPAVIAPSDTEIGVDCEDEPGQDVRLRLVTRARLRLIGAR